MSQNHIPLNEVDTAVEENKCERFGGKNHDTGIPFGGQKDNDSRLCGELKENFRDIGFAKWDGGWQPVIQLSPFDAPSGPLRIEWLNIFKNVKEKKMPRLVYWYGTPHWKNLTRAFSLIHHRDIISHDEGVKMGLNKFPNPQKKVGTEMKLTEHDEFLINGLEELETELALPKEERVAWLRKK